VIGQGDAYNTGLSSQILFTFYHQRGGSESVSVQLDSAIGAQNFVFGVTGITSVSWVTTFGDSGVGQFDNINVSAVPEPAAWALMRAGPGLVGAQAKRRRAA
jgi:hypothetical protein